MSKMITTSAAFKNLAKVTGIPYECWKGTDVWNNYAKMWHAKKDFNPFTNDPNCKTCGKK